MDFSQNDLRDWFTNHPALSIRKLEKQARLPVDTLRHFVKNRRDLNPQHFQSLKHTLQDYGYASLTSE